MADQVFFVDPDASSHGSGTEASPFQHLRRIRTNFTTTDNVTVRIKRGTILEGDATLFDFQSAAGLSPGSISIETYGTGERPIIRFGKRVSQFGGTVDPTYDNIYSYDISSMLNNFQDIVDNDRGGSYITQINAVLRDYNGPIGAKEIPASGLAANVASSSSFVEPYRTTDPSCFAPEVNVMTGSIDYNLNQSLLTLSTAPTGSWFYWDDTATIYVKSETSNAEPGAGTEPDWIVIPDDVGGMNWWNCVMAGASEWSSVTIKELVFELFTAAAGATETGRSINIQRGVNTNLLDCEFRYTGQDDGIAMAGNNSDGHFEMRRCQWWGWGGDSGIWVQNDALNNNDFTFETTDCVYHNGADILNISDSQPANLLLGVSSGVLGAPHAGGIESGEVNRCIILSYNDKVYTGTSNRANLAQFQPDTSFMDFDYTDLSSYPVQIRNVYAENADPATNKVNGCHFNSCWFVGNNDTGSGHTDNGRWTTSGWKVAFSFCGFISMNGQGFLRFDNDIKTVIRNCAFYLKTRSCSCNFNQFSGEIVYGQNLIAQAIGGANDESYLFGTDIVGGLGGSAVINEEEFPSSTLFDLEGNGTDGSATSTSDLECVIELEDPLVGNLGVRPIAPENPNGYTSSHFSDAYPDDNSIFTTASSIPGVELNATKPTDYTTINIYPETYAIGSDPSIFTVGNTRAEEKIPLGYGGLDGREYVGTIGPWQPTGNILGIIQEAAEPFIVNQTLALATNQNEPPQVKVNGIVLTDQNGVDGITYKLVGSPQYSPPVTIELLGAGTNQEIRYTTNRRNPNSKSKLYTGPIVLNRNDPGGGSDNTVIKARFIHSLNPGIKSKIIIIEFRVGADNQT